MTVKELINELEDMPQDAEVLVDHSMFNGSVSNPDFTIVECVAYDSSLELEAVRDDRVWAGDEDPPEEFVVLT